MHERVSRMTETRIMETVNSGCVLHSKQAFMTSDRFQTDRMCYSNGLGQRFTIGMDKERHRVSFGVNPFQSFGRIILSWTTNTHSPQMPMFWVPNRFVGIKEGRIQSNNAPGTVLVCRINANHTGREVNWPIPPTPPGCSRMFQAQVFQDVPSSGCSRMFQA